MSKAKRLDQWAVVGLSFVGFVEGKEVKISKVIDFKTGVLITKTGSRYTLEQPYPLYETNYPNALWRVWDSLNWNFNKGKVYPPDSDDPDFDYKSLWWQQWMQRLPKSDRRRQLAESPKDDWQIYHPSIGDWTSGNACDAIDALIFYGWPIRLGEMEMGDVTKLKESAERCLQYYRSPALPSS